VFFLTPLSTTKIIRPPC